MVGVEGARVGCTDVAEGVIVGDSGVGEAGARVGIVVLVEVISANAVPSFCVTTWVAGLPLLLAAAVEAKSVEAAAGLQAAARRSAKL